MRLAQFSLLCVFFGLTGCYPGTLYKPDQTVVSRVTVAQARQALLHSAGEWITVETKGTTVEKWNLRLARSGTALRVQKEDGSVCTAPLQYFATGMEGTYFGVFEYNQKYQVMLSGTSWGCGVGMYGFPTEEGAREFTDAIWVLSHTPLNQLRIREDPAVQVAFDQAAQKYRAQPAKPELPEEASKYKVQADAAEAQKHFDDAVDLYGNALKAAPWWPEGHYHRAVLMANVEDYLGAVQEMKKYLALTPDAPDARQAREMMYQWEDSRPAVQQPVASASPAAPAPTPAPAPPATSLIVAVFDVEDAAGKFDKKSMDQLTDYLAAKLTEVAGYHVVPRDQIRNRLVEEKKEGYRKCFDEACQIELGRALAAEKSLSTKLLRVGDKCAIASTLFDLKTETTSRAASVDTDCTENSLLEGMKKIAQQLAVH